jgi:hypothetical protein
MHILKVDLMAVALAGGIFVSAVLYYLFRWEEGAPSSEVRGLGALVFLLGFLVIGTAYVVGLYGFRSMPAGGERLARSQKLKRSFRKAVAVYGGCFLLYVFAAIMLAVFKL